MKNKVRNDIELNKRSVWTLTDRKPFNYSDGIASEKYLEKVFTKSQDLSSTSYKLERWIKDWPSEYHLSRKRAQLLSGFFFERSKKVLEVGSGCGAITRFLGETFDDVIAVEGSMERASLTRLRTRDMSNVSVICAPFQDIRFVEKFDIIFCIGVFEYSASFVNASDPYDTILRHFKDLLSPRGVVVLAIENQFGLKYFSSSSEDHTNRMFEGIEGYPYYKNNVRTFGYDEIKTRILQHFSHCDFHFPYPDYKIPSCVLSEGFLKRVKAGELVGQFQSRDYARVRKPLFDESLAYFELDRNNKIPFFSNSFLIFASDAKQGFLSRDLGILFSAGRAEQFQTITRFLDNPDGSIIASKIPIAKHRDISMLAIHPVVDRWQSGVSLHVMIMQRARDKGIPFTELFAPCKIWFKRLMADSKIENGRVSVHGRYIDSTWRNSYISDDQCILIDQEWEWHERISINVIVIRAIYYFLDDLPKNAVLNPALTKSNTTRLIMDISESMGVSLCQSDFKEFSRLESRFSSLVYGRPYGRIKIAIDIFLWNKSFVALLDFLRKKMREVRIL